MVSLQKKAALSASVAGLIMLSTPLLAAAPKDCAASSRYVMPPGVETGSETGGEAGGVAPADLPGSRSGYKLPPKIGLDLAINPLGPAFDESRLPLGHVEIDRKTGQSSIDGQPLGGPSDAEAACLGAENKPPAR